MIRELVPGSLEVYPIKGFGAIELGVHRFHHPGHEKEWPGASELGMTRFLDPGAAEWPVGQAKFLHIWRKEQIRWTVVRQGLSLAVMGLTLGLGGAYFLNQGMRSALFGIGHIDFTVLGGLALLLLLAALLACMAPAGRAASVEPMHALRTE